MGTATHGRFPENRWIALLDEYFDYKQERQANIDDIQRLHWNHVAI
jgi:hypothetical protein